MRAQSHVPFAHHGVANNRTSPWAAHFVVSNVTKELAGADGYTYDLEWSPDAINPPINQRVRGVPPTYIECAARPTRCALTECTAQTRLLRAVGVSEAPVLDARGAPPCTVQGFRAPMLRLCIANSRRPACKPRS